MSSAIRPLVCFALIAASATARAQVLEMPRWVTAVCRDGETGPVHETEIRANGEIRVRSGPTMRDTVIGRDSVAVAELMERTRRLPWKTLVSQTAQSGKWCMLMATWRQEQRGVKWYGEYASPNLFDVGRIHADIERLGGSFYDSQPYLESGCSGGFTGGGGGKIVTKDGRFYSWERYTYDRPKMVKLERRDPVRAARLFADADRVRLLQTNYSEPSNVSCSLSLVSGGVTHTVTWAENGAPWRIRSIAKLAEELSK